MNTKTLIIVGLAAAAAYLLFLRPRKTASTQSPPGNNYVASGISLGSKILGSLLQTGGGGSKASPTGGSGFVTSYSQIGAGPADGGFVTSLDA